MCHSVRMLSDTLHFFRTLTLKRLFNLIIIRTGLFLSGVLRKPLVWGKPHTLSVEPGTICNLSCPECPVGNGTLNRESGTMDLSLFRQVIDQTSYHLNHLILYFQGEPFLVPGIFNMIRYAKRENIYVSTSTNGHFLSPETIREILDSGLDRLIISLDGATAETYRQYRRGGDFGKVTDGIKALVKERNAGGFSRPYIMVQFIYFSHNLHEKEEIRRLVKELGADKLVYKTAQFYDLDKSNQMIPGNPRFARYVLKGSRYELKYKLRNRCPRLWNTGVVTWDGKVVPCCFDKDADYVMGNVRETSFKMIWHSQKFKEFRQQILVRRKEIEMCRNCTEGLGQKIADGNTMI